MALTGTGDDTAAYRHYLASLKEAIEEEVSDPQRRKSALEVIDAWHATFREHREGLADSAKCVDGVDRRYDARPEDYYACFRDNQAVWDASVERLLHDRRSLRELLTDEEMVAVRRRVSK